MTCGDTSQSLGLRPPAPPQKQRIIKRRHTRVHLKVWEYFHKKPHIQLTGTFILWEQWVIFVFLFNSMSILSSGVEASVCRSFRLLLFARARALARHRGFVDPSPLTLHPLYHTSPVMRVAGAMRLSCEWAAIATGAGNLWHHKPYRRKIKQFKICI